MSYLYGYPQYVVDRDTGLPVVNGRGGTATDPASGAPRTPDLGGQATTVDVGRAVAECV